MNRRHRSLMITASFILLALTALVGYRIWTSQPEPDEPPAIVGQSLPATAMVTPLMSLEPHPLADEIVGVTVVNYFGSWCWPCRGENPALLELQAEGVRVIGVAVRDDPNATQQFLDDLGDPFFRVLADREGSSMQVLGIGAEVPQTLVVSADGEVLFRHSGPLVGTDGEAALEEIRELAGPR